jgi:hypothetical protein
VEVHTSLSHFQRGIGMQKTHSLKDASAFDRKFRALFMLFTDEEVQRYLWLF